MMNTRTTPRIETAEDLERIVAEQKETIQALGQLVKKMDARMQVFTRLLDEYHDILVQHGLAKPGPGGIVQ